MLPKAILVVSSPRTGSTWLLDMLAGASTTSDDCGLLFRQDVELYSQGEVLNPVFGNYGMQGWMQNQRWPPWLKRWRTDLHLMATLATPQLWRQLAQAMIPMQAKLFHAHHVVPVVKVFQEQLDYHGIALDDIRSDWPCVVLYREDMLGCYRSLVKAFDTNCWYRVDNTCSEPTQRPGQTYRQPFEEWLDDVYFRWMDLLDSLDCDVDVDSNTQHMSIQPTSSTPSNVSVLSYEQLVASKQTVVETILQEAMGARLEWQWKPTRVVKQSL